MSVRAEQVRAIKAAMVQEQSSKEQMSESVEGEGEKAAAGRAR